MGYYFNIQYLVKKMRKNPLDCFSELEDPRVDRTKLYNLEAILFQTISAVISGCDSWCEIELFGYTKRDWLQQYVSIPNGTPSHDTLSDLFKRLNPKVFEQCFRNWTSLISDIVDKDLIVFDGKRIRGSYDNYSNKSAIHMVSAWSTENQLVLAQEKVDEKSNEITAIPTLLESLELSGAIVSIDAMGCQKEIATAIIANQADYILALKANQESLFDQVKNEFTRQKLPAYNCIEKGHGRITNWEVSVQSNLTFIEETHLWKGIKSLIKVTTNTTRTIDDRISHQDRYYISSLEQTPEKFSKLIRKHWQIENNLHWTLDVQFKEDLARIRTKNANQNFSLLRKIGLNIINQAKTKGMSVNRMRLKAALDDKFRSNLMKI